MVRHVLDHVRVRTLAVLALGVGALVAGAIAVAAAEEPAQDVHAAGADIRAAADGPSAPELVRRQALEQAVGRRGARVRAAQEAVGIAEVADAKADRYAIEPAPEPPPPPAPDYASGGTVWDRLAQCESGGNWASSVGLYEGGLQFHPSTWDRNKPSGYPDAAYQASRAQQIQVAERVLARQGWGAWPSCASKLGLR